MLKQAIENTSYIIRTTTPDMQLIHTDPNFYYNHGEIGGVVHTKSDKQILFIVIHAPITLTKLHSPLTIWKINLFPLKAPDGQAYYNILGSPIKYIA